MSKDFDYEEFVIECYNDKKDQEIHNASEENALLLFNKLFEKAIRDKEDSFSTITLTVLPFLSTC
jgi:hypothetical protein